MNGTIYEVSDTCDPAGRRVVGALVYDLHSLLTVLNSKVAWKSSGEGFLERICNVTVIHTWVSALATMFKKMLSV